jgi:hypothetical protein
MELEPVVRVVSAAVVGWLTYRIVRLTLGSRPVTSDPFSPTSFFPLSDLAPSGRLRLSSVCFAILASIFVFSFVIRYKEFFADVRRAYVNGTLQATGTLIGVQQQIVNTLLQHLDSTYDVPLVLFMIIMLFWTHIKKLLAKVRDRFVIPFFILDGTPDEQVLNAADDVLASEHRNIARIEQKISKVFGSLPKIPPGVKFPDEHTYVAYLLTCLTKNYPPELTLGARLMLVQRSLAKGEKVSSDRRPLEPPGIWGILTFLLLFVIFVLGTPYLPLVAQYLRLLPELRDISDAAANGRIRCLLGDILGGEPRSWIIPTSGTFIYWPHYSHGSERLTFSINSLQIATVICIIFPMLVYIFGPHAIPLSDKSNNKNRSMLRIAFVVQFFISAIAVISIVAIKVYLANEDIIDTNVSSLQQFSLSRSDVVLEILLFSLLPFVLFHGWVLVNRLYLQYDRQYARRFIKMISLIGFLMISTAGYTFVTYLCQVAPQTSAPAGTPAPPGAPNRCQVALQTSAPAGTPAPPGVPDRTPLPLTAYSAAVLSMALLASGIVRFVTSESNQARRPTAERAG